MRFQSLTMTLTLFLSFATNRSFSRGQTIDSTDVIIGGAGYSGVSTANVLNDNEVNFIIVEASDRIGGRMYEVPFGSGNEYTIELGAQFIDGVIGNPAYIAAQKYGLGGVTQRFSFRVYDKDGQFRRSEGLNLKNTTCRAADDAYIMASVLSESCLHLTTADEPLSWREQMLCDEIKNGFDPSDIDDVSFENLQRKATGFYPPSANEPSLAATCSWLYNDFGWGEEPRFMSGKYSVPMNAYDDFSDDDIFVVDKKGFSWLVKSQAAEFLNSSKSDVYTEEIIFIDERLQMNTKVLHVQWDPEGFLPVNVTVCATIRESPPHMPNLYPCANNQTFILVGKEFISTFSLGVLQKSLDEERNNIAVELSVNKAPRFDPPLMSIANFTDSLEANVLGLYGKAFFQFPFNFWGERQEYYLSAYSSGSYTGTFAPAWFSYDFKKGANKNKYYPGSNIIMLYTAGERARDLSSLTEDNAIYQLLPVLNSMFNTTIQSTLGRELNITDVLDFQLSRWSIDPLFYGGFSSWREGYTRDDQATISARYGNLIFSGEHTCYRHHGYTHGAKLAGERTAQMLLKDRYGFSMLNTDTLCDFSPAELKEREIKFETSEDITLASIL